MNTIIFFLAYVGVLAFIGGAFFLILNEIDSRFTTNAEIRSCKRDIERLERQIKNLQCNRQ